MGFKGWLGVGAGLVLFASGGAQAMELDSGIPAEQSQLIRQDLEYLSRIQYQDNEADRNTAQLMKIRGRLTGAGLKSWLETRVSTIVSEDLDIAKALLIAPGTGIYPEPTVFPAQEEASPKAKAPSRTPSPSPGEKSEDSRPRIVMANVGAAIYLMAKKNRVVLALRKANGSLHPLLSPRGGIIQIGEGLFYKKFQVDAEHPNAPANSISRLSTFFHEARHSDGHGATLGFTHAICPEGHAYGGYPACDRNLNGPYTVGAQVLKSLAQGCGDCGVKEKMILKAIEADARTRILRAWKTTDGKEHQAGDWSDRPEKILKFIEKPDGGHSETRMEAATETH